MREAAGEATAGQRDSIALGHRLRPTPLAAYPSIAMDMTQYPNSAQFVTEK